MRVLHAAYMPHHESGILRQMHSEQEAADRMAIPWTTRLMMPDRGTPSPVLVPLPGARGLTSRNRIARWLHGRRAYYTWLRRESQQHDLVLLRHHSTDPLQWRFCRTSPKPVLTVHHTLEGPELQLRSRGLKSHTYTLADSVLTALTMRYTEGIVALTPEIGTYECARPGVFQSQVFDYPNGIDVGSEDPPDARPPEHPELLFLSSFFGPWQGLDLLLASVARSTATFTLHIAGRVTETLSPTILNDPRVVFHGLVDQDQIAALAARCTVGIAPLALERKGMQEACALKVRDYLSRGLAVYGAYREPFPGDFAYFRQGRPDIDAILTYAAMISEVDKPTIKREALGYIDKGALLQKLYNALTSHFTPPGGPT